MLRKVCAPDLHIDGSRKAPPPHPGVFLHQLSSLVRGKVRLALLHLSQPLLVVSQNLLNVPEDQETHYRLMHTGILISHNSFCTQPAGKRSVRCKRNCILPGRHLIRHHDIVISIRHQEPEGLLEPIFGEMLSLLLG